MKDKIITITFISFLIIVLLSNIIVPDNDISSSERRKLKQIPKISVSGIMDTSFMEDFDEYVLDQFIFRNEFRSLKANVNYKLFQKIDNNGIYVVDDYIFKVEYPINIKSVDNFIDTVNQIGNNFTPANKVYYTIIPDKNYYSDKEYLNINYDLLYEKIKEINYEYIELRDVLELEDYYKTDTHWKQENLEKVIKRLGSVMNFEIDTTYQENKVTPFYGVYYGQAALNKGFDSLVYLTNDSILNSRVYYYENDKINSVYSLGNLNNLDKYDIYLDGASSFIEIENPNSKSDRELVIFRDSFGSSLAPLLIDYYSKITLIDIRYIDSSNYLKLITFNNQDILFMYSTLIINNSNSLKR